MIAIQGYFDGVQIRPIGEVIAKPNQRVIITIMDEFVDPVDTVAKKGMRGALAKYADPALVKKEKDAWKSAVVKKHGSA